MQNSREQFCRQHGREADFYGVVDLTTQKLMCRCRTAPAADRAAKAHNLLTRHETAYCLEDSVMLGYWRLRY